MEDVEAETAELKSVAIPIKKTKIATLLALKICRNLKKNITLRQNKHKCDLNLYFLYETSSYRQTKPD